jgi:hypothetical protein
MTNRLLLRARPVACVTLIVAAVMAATSSLRSQTTPGSNVLPPRDARTPSAAVGTGTIRGRVVDAADRRPLRGVRIQIPSYSIADVFTDEGGRYTVTGLPAGRYTLTAVKTGYVTSWRRDRAPSVDAQIAGPPIDVRAGQITGPIDFALTRGGVISGRVVDNRGREVIGARVYVYRSRWQDGRQSLAMSGVAADQTNDLGEFRLFGIPPGTYLLGVNFARPDGEGRETVFSPGSYSPAGAAPLVIRSGDELSASITFPAISWGSIAGVVSEAGGSLPPYTWVSARQISSEEVRPIGADISADGSFRLVALVPGEYEVTAFTNGTNPTQFASARVTVDGQDVFVPLALSAGGTIRGHYRFDTGAPPADLAPPEGEAVIPVDFPHEDARRMSVEADWSFSIKGLSGAYRLMPPSPAGWHVKQITRNRTDITYQPIEIASDTTDGVEILLTQKTTQLTVSLDGTDSEFEDATFLIFPEDESRMWPSSPLQRVIRVGERRLPPGAAQSLDRRSLTVSALPAARYYAVAVAGLEYEQETNPARLRELTAIASKVELVENETRQIRLKIKQLP